VENVMTKEGLQALHAELEQLETTGRQEIAQQIKTAREWGDLKENAEYHAAKNAQAHLETRILQLRDQIDRARVVEVGEAGDVVALGATVEVEDEQSAKRVSYRLVAQHEAAPAEGRLSFHSPVGTALQGKRVGEVAVVETPRGGRRLRVLSIS
jgi:transcription elongation factor GreA